MSKKNLNFGFLNVKNLFTENGEINFKTKKYQATCKCGNKTDFGIWDFVLRRKISCGCIEPIALENEILGYLEDHDIPYLLDFKTRERNGNPISFDILIPYDNGKIIMYDQDKSYHGYDDLKNARETYKKIEKKDKGVENLTGSFDMDFLYIKYTDLGKVKKILDLFFKKNLGDK